MPRRAVGEWIHLWRRRSTNCRWYLAIRCGWHLERECRLAAKVCACRSELNFYVRGPKRKEVAERHRRHFSFLCAFAPLLFWKPFSSRPAYQKLIGGIAAELSLTPTLSRRERGATCAVGAHGPRADGPSTRGPTAWQTEACPSFAAGSRRRRLAGGGHFGRLRQPPPAGEKIEGRRDGLFNGRCIFSPLGIASPRRVPAKIRGPSPAAGSKSKNMTTDRLLKIRRPRTVRPRSPAGVRPWPPAAWRPAAAAPWKSPCRWPWFRRRIANCSSDHLCSSSMRIAWDQLTGSEGRIMSEDAVCETTSM